MIPGEPEIKLFHAQLFEWAETYLDAERETGFKRIAQLGDRFSDSYLGVLRSLKSEDFPPFRRASVRRCYNRTFLEWLDQSIESNERQVFARAGSSFPPVPDDEAIHPYSVEAKKNLRKELRTHFPKAGLDGGVLTLDEMIGHYRLVTDVDMGHRDGSIDYSHTVFNESGIQLSQIPLCVSSWCGIASMTTWRPRVPDDFYRIKTALMFHIGEFRDWLIHFEAKHERESPTNR